MSSSSSPTSPPSSAWIQHQHQHQHSTGPSSNKRTMIEPLNLWPSSSTWAAYSSALASLTLGQLNCGIKNGPKYSQSRNSPLTPTTPTYSPVFSPTSLATNSFVEAHSNNIQHQLEQPITISDGPNSPISRGASPLSPHSVADGCTDTPTSSFPLSFCYATSTVTEFAAEKLNMGLVTGSKRPLETEGFISQQQKRSKSFTIDAILGLASCHESNQKELYCATTELGTVRITINDKMKRKLQQTAGWPFNSILLSTCTDHYNRMESPIEHHQRHLSSSESSESSPQQTTALLPAGGASSSTTINTMSLSSSPRTKRVRTIFSAEQLEKLELEFARQQYMVINLCAFLSINMQTNLILNLIIFY